MQEFQKRVAAATMKNSMATFVILMLITAFFAIGIQRVDIRTIFSDLFPKNHPFVETFKDHPNFGNPLTVVMMVKVKNGDIYNPETLEKCLSIGFNSDMPPTFPTTGCPAPRALPTTGQWDDEINELAQQFVESINSENMELLNEIFNERPTTRARDRDSTRTTNRYVPYSGGKKKKKSKKKKKTKKRNKSKKRR